MRNNEQISESDRYRSNFPFLSGMKNRLKVSSRSTQVKFDILTVKTFKETIQNGTKLLHINYDLQIQDETELYFE